MKAGVLFSGGKDSSLAAIMLGTYYEVELNVFVFDPSRQVPSVDAAAQVLGFPLKKRVFDKGLLDDMVDLVKTCGYPNDAINTVHQIAVETLSSSTQWLAMAPGLMTGFRCFRELWCRVLATGTGCSYVRPLLGYVKPEVDRLGEPFFHRKIW